MVRGGRYDVCVSVALHEDGARFSVLFSFFTLLVPQYHVLLFKTVVGDPLFKQA